MGDKTKIEWTDASWTPVRARNLKTGKIGWHCEHVSPGCGCCYAGSMNVRLGTGLQFKPGHLKDVEIFLDAEMLTQPLRWKRPRKIFVCSMTDLFASFVPEALVDAMFAVMALCPQHTFQILTKRPDLMRAYMDRKPRDLADGSQGWSDAINRAAMSRLGRPVFPSQGLGMVGHPGWPLPNVWMGTSVEDQAWANARIPYLLATRAAVHFLSCEPLLGPVDLTRWIPRDRYYNAVCEHCGHAGSTEFFDECRGQDDADVVCPICHRITLAEEVAKIGWVIGGGESGQAARPMHRDWPRQLRDQCAAAGIPFLFKQWGEWKPHRPQAGGDLGGDVRRGKVDIVHPTGESSLEVFGRTKGHNTIPGSHYMIRVGKSEAGRLLDGVEHNGFPNGRL